MTDTTGRALEVVTSHCDENDEGDPVASTLDRDAAVGELASWLQEQLTEQRDALEVATDASVFSDLLSAAISEVDWYEIAESYVGDAIESLSS